MQEIVRLAPDVPVVVLTGWADAGAALDAVRAGAQDFLPKNPLDAIVLARTLRYAIERKRAQTGDHFLAEAGRLLAATLDYETTLENVARLAVQSIADCCVVDIADADDSMRRLQVAHRDPSKRAVAEKLKRYEVDPHRPHLLHDVIRTREPVLMPEVRDEDLAELAQDAEHLKILQELAIRSYMGVPLVANDRLVGTLLFASSRRSFDADDLSLAEKLGRLAALEVDNANHYRLAQQAIRARDKVLGVVAHDLRNPLSTIAMSAELLLEPDWDVDQRNRQLEVIRRSAARMDRLIEDLLDVARIEGDRLSLNRTHQNPKLLVREAVELNQALATKRRLTLRSEIPDDCGPIHADHDRVIQVLSNLLGNALKFTPKGGEIVVSLRPSGDVVGFAVSDTGPGIPAELLPELFKPFWQARRGGTDGAGLGLAIARGIVEAHGGRIWAESEVGKGTTLSFTIPSAADRRGAG